MTPGKPSRAQTGVLRFPGFQCLHGSSASSPVRSPSLRRGTGGRRLSSAPDGQRFVAPTIVQMRRLKTREELWEKSRPLPEMVPSEKMQAWIRAVNLERQMLGLSPEGGKQ